MRAMKQELQRTRLRKHRVHRAAMGSFLTHEVGSLRYQISSSSSISDNLASGSAACGATLMKIFAPTHPPCPWGRRARAIATLRLTRGRLRYTRLLAFPQCMR